MRDDPRVRREIGGVARVVEMIVRETIVCTGLSEARAATADWYAIAAIGEPEGVERDDAVSPSTKIERLIPSLTVQTLPRSGS